MAVSRIDLINMSESDKKSYLKLRKSLDSLNDVVLAEFDLTKSPSDKTAISRFVSEHIREILKQFAKERGKFWDDVSPDRAEDFAKHSRELLGTEKPPETQALFSKDNKLCPPGFVEVDGICVPI